MRKTKIGIPRFYLYYKYGVFVKKYFEYLGCNVILSPKTNYKIIKLGTDNCGDNPFCLANKTYIGHLIYLNKISDYVLIPKENNSNCKLLNDLDISDDIIPNEKIINYHMNIFSPLNLLKISLKFTKNPLRIIISYILAKNSQKEYLKTQYNTQKNQLNNPNKKVLIVSQFYNLEDNLYNTYITRCLKEHQIIPLYSNKLNKKITNKFYKYSIEKIKDTSIKQILASLNYYKYHISGIIYINYSNCPYTKNIYHLIKQIPALPPILNLTIKENNYEDYLETELENYLIKLGDVNE